MKQRNGLRKVVLGGTVLLALLTLFAHPYFAITRPSHAPALVAEGWMHHEGLRAAKELFAKGGYTHLYVTGTLRPFAYYLAAGDTLNVQLPQDFNGRLDLDVAGLPGSSWQLLADADLLAEGSAEEDMRAVSVELGKARNRALRIIAAVEQDPGEPVLFVASLRLNGADPHALGLSISIHHHDGTQQAGSPTIAHQGVELLLKAGVPAGAITAVPSYSTQRRTRSEARSMAEYARTRGLTGYDVATLGVHARRTWTHYAEEARSLQVGIISLDDPWCRRWTWCLNPYGWFQVMKELAALPGTLWRAYVIAQDDSAPPAATTGE